MDDDRDPRRPPRFCYLVMCHSDPEVALALGRRLRALSPGCAVLLRHDHGAGWIDAARAAEAGIDVLLSERHVVWGEWAQTEAFVEGLEQARARLPADWYVVVSGQDHPVRALAAWEREVVASGADVLLAPADVAFRDHGYTWRAWQPPQRVPLLARRVVAAGWRAVTPVLRPLVQANPVRGTTRWTVGVVRAWHLWRRPPVPVHKAALWMTLDARALDSFLARHRQDGASRRYFSRARLSDEYYFASLLRDDPSLVVVDAATTHARFPPGGWSPVWVDAAELELARSRGTAFVRKLPDDADDVRALADAAVDADAAAEAAAGT